MNDIAMMTLQLKVAGRKTIVQPVYNRLLCTQHPCLMFLTVITEGSRDGRSTYIYKEEELQLFLDRIFF